MLTMIMRIIIMLLRQIGIFFDKTLLITYSKIVDVPHLETGYIDVDIVAKRYKESAKKNNYLHLLNQQAVKDNFYFLEKECREYFNKIKPGTKLLDVGCGSGTYSKVFKRPNNPFENISYYGTEIDNKIIEICKQYNPNGMYFVSVADKIIANDKSYDIVFCSGTLHYTLKKWKKSIKEMMRVSNKYLVISRFPVTKYNDTFYVHQVVRGISGTENHYFVVINRSILEKYFVNLGLKILKRDYSSEVYNVKNVDEKIVLVQYLLQKTNNKINL